MLPFFLGTVLGGIAAGEVDVAHPETTVSAWTGPTSIAAGVLAVSTCAYIAAVFLAGDARRAGQPDLEAAFRTRSLAVGVVTGAASIAALVVLRSDARPLFDGLTSGAGLALVVVSARRSPHARTDLDLALRARAVDRGRRGGRGRRGLVGRQPSRRAARVHARQAAAPDATLTALVISVALGLLVLVPSLWYLYRLVLRGTLDQSYEPLDQRFRPIDEDHS